MMSAQKANNLDSLTGLRGVAAYSVLIAHAVDTAFSYGDVPTFHRIAERLAYFGMSLFFVLSGFVIHYNYSESFARERLRVAAYKFFVARFARLYPLYVIGIIMSMPQIPVPNFTAHPGLVLFFLTLTQSWFNVELAIFPPDWSVSTEWFFYFAYIPLMILVRSIIRPVRALALHCILAPLVLLLLFYLLHDWLIELVQANLYLDEKVSAGAWGFVTYFAPAVRLLEFVAGVLAAQAYLVLRARPSPSRKVSVALPVALGWCFAVIAVGGLTHPPLRNILPNMIFAPALAPLMLHLCLFPSSLSRLLSSRLLMFMGEISYSVYIWSFFVLTMLAASFHVPTWSPLAFANGTFKVVVVGVTTVVAYGSYILIEAPARRWLRRALNRPIAGTPLPESSPRA
jgi:peptidoglycan/LPS O-acetylase OafA/YrhL